MDPAAPPTPNSSSPPATPDASTPSLKVVARGEGITLTGSEVTVTVGLLKDDGAFSLAVVITADLPGVSPEQGEKLLQLAHQRCPYSKATRGNIDVQLTLSQPAENATR